MKVLRVLLLLVLVPAGIFILFLLFATVDDYKPREVVSLPVSGTPSEIADTAELDLLIWNIGYAGLDASMDFFYDGGKQMRPEKEDAAENLEGIVNILATYEGYDFILLQEVDRDSKRSYRTEQVNLISNELQGYHTSFAKNYDVAFVPIPPGQPMGKVTSGLLTLSGYNPAVAERHSFPGNYSWPVRLFMLDRCFLVERHKLSRGKDLLVINTHNSAYDDGTLRSAQMAFLKDFLVSEYNRGNYVIVGGDWNQTPHGMEPELPGHVFDTINLSYVEKDYPSPGWTWAYDPGTPTNRRVALPYDRTSSLTTVIDYYLLSPNIELLDVRTMDLDFRFSDHNPVSLRIRLQKE